MLKFVQAQARQNTMMEEENGHEFPPLAEMWLAIRSFREINSQVSLSDWPWVGWSYSSIWAQTQEYMGNTYWTP